MKKIAITGGIGSGKSTAVKYFQELGIPYVDADEVARDLRKPGQPAHTAILSRFGTDDRMELRKILSHDIEAKAELEAILHPLIKAGSEELFARIESHSKAPFLLYEAALIIEAGRTQDFDGLIVVTSPTDHRIARIMDRDHLPKDSALAMIHAQMSDAERVKHATHILDNSGDLLQLKTKVQDLYSALK